MGAAHTVLHAALTPVAGLSGCPREGHGRGVTPWDWDGAGLDWLLPPRRLSAGARGQATQRVGGGKGGDQHSVTHLGAKALALALPQVALSLGTQSDDVGCATGVCT